MLKPALLIARLNKAYRSAADAVFPVSKTGAWGSTIPYDDLEIGQSATIPLPVLSGCE